MPHVKIRYYNRRMIWGEKKEPEKQGMRGNDVVLKFH